MYKFLHACLFISPTHPAHNESKSCLLLDHSGCRLECKQTRRGCSQRGRMLILLVFASLCGCMQYKGCGHAGCRFHLTTISRGAGGGGWSVFSTAESSRTERGDGGARGAALISHSTGRHGSFAAAAPALWWHWEGSFP